MFDWWYSLSIIQQIFLCIAIPSTLILLIQTVLVLFGLGDNDADADIDADTDLDNDGLALFSIRGIMSMLAVMGWSAVALLETSLYEAISIIISTVLGLATLFAIAYIMKLVSKLQASGNIDMGSAVNKVGEVYIPIPPNASGSGKINLTVQEKYCEFNAITTYSETLKTGAYVRVVAVNEAGMLVVEPISSNNNL